MVVSVGYITVSAEIPRRLKKLLDRFGIKPGPVIRRALEKEVKKRVLSELEEEARALSERLSHISDEEVASIIREDREKR
jgi:Mg/Co/Ni transporter MgtE